MKSIILTLISLVFFTMAQSQESWTICYGKKTILKKVAENKQKNLFTISKSSLSTNSKLTIQLHEVDTTNYITLMANLEDGTNLKEWEYAGKTFIIPASELKSMAGTNSKLLFYYRSIPKDPEKAAVVRIRPVHVCTISIK
jgi:hypothetical protein